jgi:ABC-2 type transport system ATP-binding protein
VPVIEVENLTKTYRGDSGESVRALAGVSFAVEPGQIYGLLGPNGAGKSTLVRILTTITPPTSGRAVVAGFDVVRNPLDVRRKIAVVLQQTAVETMLTVEDNLLIYAYLHGVSRSDARRRIRGVLDEFELADKVRETVQDLSLGMRRRVQVAKIFMVDSPVIFLDEATTGMDPLMKRRVMERIRAESRNGRSVLLTTQILSEAEQLCDAIMIIDHGRLLASGTLQHLRTLSQHLFRVNVTFADGEGNGDFRGRLEQLQPAELEIEGRSARMLFRGEESSLIEKLAELSRHMPIAQFEVRGPDLEEIFVSLVEKKQ